MPCRACGANRPNAGARCTYSECPARAERAPRPRAAPVTAAAIRRSLIASGRVRPKQAAA
jgi:hypothetical protein